MAYKSGFASSLSGGLGGAGAFGGVSTGMAAAGMTVAPWLAPLMIGGGALAGFLGNQADEEAMENDPEYQMQKRRAGGMKLVSRDLGRAFSAMKTPKLGAL